MLDYHRCFFRIEVHGRPWTQLIAVKVSLKPSKIGQHASKIIADAKIMDPWSYFQYREILILVFKPWFFTGLSKHIRDDGTKQ